jgi:hypothetical protein
LLLPSFRSLTLSPEDVQGHRILRTLAWIAFSPTLQSSLEDLKSHFFSHHLLCLVSVHHCLLRDGFPVRRLAGAKEPKRRDRRCKGSCFCLRVHKTSLPRAIQPRLRYQLCKQSDGMSLLMCSRRSTLGYVFTAAIIPVDSTKYNAGDRDILTWLKPEFLVPMT